MTTIKKKFGVHLFQLRNAAGMTQARLAEITNLSVDSISRIERGERAPSLESIEKISDALKVRSSELFNFESEEIASLSDLDDNGDIKGFRAKMQADMTSFANGWMENIKDQQKL